MARVVLHSARAMLRRRLPLSLACVALGLVAPRSALAQDAGAVGSVGAESINVGGQENPSRFLYETGVCNGCVATDVTGNTRADGHNPEGVNYGDCEQNLRLDFSLATSGFGLGDGSHVEIWAGTADCTQDENRSPDNADHPCWQVAPSIASPKNPLTVSVYARDVIRYEVSSGGAAVPYDPAFNDSRAGETACTVQPSDAAISLGIYFIPLVGTTPVGAAYEYGITADTVGPPPPPLSPLVAGDTLIPVNWTSLSSDPDVQGYVVYSDPPGSSAGSGGGCGCGSPGGGSTSSSSDIDASATKQDSSILQCTDSAVEASGAVDASSSDSAADHFVDGSPGAEAATSDGDVDGEGADGGTSEVDGGMPDAGGVEDGSALPESGVAADAGAPFDGGGGIAADAGNGGLASCTPIKGGSNGGCIDPVLTDNQISIGAATSTTTTSSGDGGDDAGDASGIVVVVGTGGISSISAAYQSATAVTSSTSVTLTGLTNFTVYHVVVASVDGSDNVGPTSTLRCGTPQPVHDFWATYKAEGGGAGGCALESGSPSEQGSIFGLGMIAAAAAWLRRRRR